MSSLPEGSNSLGAWESYEERQYYKSVSTLVGTTDKSRIDSKDIPLYGKVDTKGRQIMLPRSSTLLSEERLFTVSEVEDIPATDIVTNSFISLRQRMNLLSARGEISENSVYYNLSADVSYLSWEKGFKNVMEQIIDDILSYVLERDKNNPVLDIEDFIIVFQEYIYESCPYSVVTLNNYLFSRFSDPLETGMVVEVSTDNASDDNNKTKKYLNDSAFSTFVEEASSYGFLVDSSIPWRLILNPNSEYVTSYLKSEGYPTFQKYLESNYISPDNLSFDFFVRLVLDAYRNLVLKSPNVTRINSGELSTNFELVDRKPLELSAEGIESFSSKIGISRLLKLYTFSRIQEKNIFLTKKQFDKLHAESVSYKKSDKSLDIQKSLQYIQYQIGKLEKNKKAKSEFRI